MYGINYQKGRFFKDRVFTIREEKLIKFEKMFPVKEKSDPKIDLNL